jgi:putative ABC transport system permease protein
MKFLNSRSKKSRSERSIAWAQLTHRKVRFAVAIGGIAFANVLIFMQLGFRALFTEGATVLPENIAGDLFLVSPSSDYIGANGFELIRLYQANAIQGVESATPLYINDGTWAHDQNHVSYQARFFAFNPTQTVFKIPEIERQKQLLNQPNSVLLDRYAKSTFGEISSLIASGKSARALIKKQRVDVVGMFSLGNSFFLGEGNVVMSESTYAAIHGEASLKQVGVGILRLAPGANLDAVKAGIRANVPGVVVLDRKELIAKEVKFQETTPAEPIFAFGAVMGFVVGIAIVYQVLYSDVSDHLAEYATLKAIGYSDGILLGVIFQEALILCVVGFIPGCGISYFMYQFLAGITRLDLIMRLDVAIVVLVLTLVMCLVSAAIASNKLRSADPADVF